MFGYSCRVRYPVSFFRAVQLFASSSYVSPSLCCQVLGQQFFLSLARGQEPKLGFSAGVLLSQGTHRDQLL